MSVALLEAVRGLHVADPDLGVKPLLAKLREQQPDLGAGNKEVREALIALKVEGEAKVAAAAAAASASAAATAAATAPPAADEGDAPSNAALSLACIGCFRLPSDMDDGREKHPICDMCRDEKLPTTYQCGKNCPANPGAWKLHGVFHKELRKSRKRREDGGVTQQRNREAAERQAREAARTGDKYQELGAKGALYTPLSRTGAKQPRPTARPSPCSPTNLLRTTTSATCSSTRGTAWRPRSGSSRPRSAFRWAQRTGQRPREGPSTI